MICLFLDRQWAKGYSNGLKISLHFILNSIGINDWAVIHSLVAKGLTGIKTAGVIPPTQPLAILAVVGLGSAAASIDLFLTHPDDCSTFLGG